MTKVQSHRGPDGQGHLLLGRTARLSHCEVPAPRETDFLAFGHLRLAIVDTSATGAQPMASPDGLDWITYNGEVYNFVELRRELEQLGHGFVGHSDTEVLLAAYRQWGTRCFERFNGMWAIGLWDGRRQRLILSRDRFGVKPLCFAQLGSTLFFASEFKALLGANARAARLNTRLAIDFLKFSLTNHTNESFFEGLSSFPPGHFAVVDPADPRVDPERFWSLSPGDDHAAFDRGEIEEQFRHLFRDAVRLRLRSDVPVGSCLSGGLDSSSIVCQAHKLRSPESPQFQTFHAASTDPRLDERKWADLVNSRVGGAAHVVFPASEGFIQDLDELVWHQEEPFTSASIYAQWLIMRAARDARIPVLLDGQGADEALCGYRKFYALYLRQLVRRGRFGSAAVELGHLLRNGDRGMLNFAHAARYLPSWAKSRKGLAATIRHAFGAAWDSSQQDLLGDGSISQRQICDLTRFSVPALLRYEDRNSMAWSIETRVPFLDYRLVEFLVSAPVGVKLIRGRTKALLRTALQGMVPEEVLSRRDKLGFVTEQERWMRGGLGNLIAETIGGKDFPFGAWLDARTLAAGFDEWRSTGKGIDPGDAFRVFLLSRWVTRFSATV